MKNLVIKYWLFISLIFTWLVFSQAVQAIKFYSINSLFGISSRSANSICKDDNGFIWAASKTGILRLSGNSYRIYDLPYETTGAVVVTLNYKNSKLIAYTNNGQVFIYNPVFDRFELLINLRKALDNENFDVFGILPDPHGDYWIALNSGIYKFHGGKITLVDESQNDRYLFAWYNGKTLLVVDASKISLLDTYSGKSKTICQYSNINPGRISELFFDSARNRLWIGTYSKGLFCYTFGSSNITPMFSSSFPRQPVLAMTESSESTLLIGVDGQGLWEVDKNRNEIINVFKENNDDPFSLRGNGVYDIFCEPGERVWICTVSGGVSFYNLASPLVNQITHRTNDQNSLVNNDVNSIIEDKSGQIWFATNNGISRWNKTTNQWKSFYFDKVKQAQVFLSICEDDQGRIWAGSYSSGVYLFDGTTGKELAHYAESAPASNFIFDIFKDSEGDIWIGGAYGQLPCFVTRENKFRTYENVSISAFAEISPGQILLGGSYGVKLLDKKSGVISNLLPGYEVQDLLVLNKTVWIGTSGEGLLEFNLNDRTTSTYTIKDGLPSNFVNSIAFAENNLWLGTENGLCQFDLKSKTAVTFPSIVPLSGFSYNKCAIFRLNNSQLACGTNNGAVLFDPQSIQNIPAIGKIFFQNINIAGRPVRDIPSMNLQTPVDSLKTLTLGYAENTINLELIPFGTGSKFSWKLEGFDREWSSPSENRFVAYTNLPAGKFELKIRLYDNSVSGVIAERLLAIRIIPPFWRAWWFWLVLVIVGSSVVLLSLLYYINRLKQEHTEEKVRFFTNTAHDIRTSLTLIKAPVEELRREKGLTEQGKHYLKLAVEHARQLSSVVNQLIDFQKVDIGKEHLSLSMIDLVQFIEARRMLMSLYAESKNVGLLFHANCESYLTAFDEQKMEKIIDNLISNAVKYSPNNGQVTIELKCSETSWTLQVKDNGIGISRKAQRQLFNEFYRGENAINSKVVGSGIGLLLVKKYVLLHSGKITCQSEENVGSVFQVVIPHKTIQKPLVATNFASEIVPVINHDDIETVRIANEPEFLSKDLKVLVVEDNDDLLKFLKSTLGNYFKVYTATDGEEAWKFIEKQIPDLIVSDVMMPRMDGFELCRLIKSTYETSHIPVVLLTALSEKTDQLQGLGLGADDYLTKPFDMNLLIRRISSIIRNREIVREKAIKTVKEMAFERVLDNELNDNFIKRIFEIAQANLSNPEFSKEDFASEMNVSTSLLYKKMKSLTGQSPTDFMKTIRLNHALDILKSGKYTVTEVSELCGFTSLTYFGTVFKKHFEKSPSEILE